MIPLAIPYSSQIRPPQMCPLSLGDDSFKVEIRLGDVEEARFGPRFDTSGTIGQVELHGQPYLIWPGLCDEFGTAGWSILGFDEADRGETFLKIGVGALVKSDTESYSSCRYYEVRHYAPIALSHHAQQLTVHQKMIGINGYGYRISKTYCVEVGQNTVNIQYQLTNIGERFFDFEHYNHNWFGFGQQGDSVTPMFSFNPTTPCWLKSGGQCLRLKHPIEQPEVFWSDFYADKSLNHIAVSDAQGVKSVVISGDFDVNRFVLYAESEALCPEVFIRRRVRSGETAWWQRKYQFVLDN